MRQVPSDGVTPALRALFRTDEPQACRCFGVLEGNGHPGKILTDDLGDPTWGIVWEGCDGATFIGGELDPTTVLEALNDLRREGQVLVGLWLDDSRQALLPPDPYYDGRTLEFYDRPVGAGLEQYLCQVPQGCEIRQLDRDLILRTEWGPDDVALAGGVEVWERTHIGYCLMRDGDILSEATVGPPALGLREPGVFTQPEHRGKGYATLTAARLVHEVEALGDRTYWNCAKQNLASAAVARKLGYRVAREYRCVAWSQLGRL
jgi:GNAT superfamily N-acetyltransferase